MMIFPKLLDKLKIVPSIVFRLIFGAFPHSINWLFSRQPDKEIKIIIIKNDFTILLSILTNLIMRKALLSIF